MFQGPTTAATGGIRSCILLAGAAAGCALAAGLSLLWLALIDGGPGNWVPLLPPAMLGALSGLLLVRLLPLSREANPAWLRVCMHCHGVNPDPDQGRSQQGWLPVDQYLEKALAVEVSHGICPHCVREHYGQETPGTSAPQT